MKIGRKVFIGLVLVCLSATSQWALADTCTSPGVTLYFVNGINTSPEDAESEREALQQDMSAFIPGTQLQGICLGVAVAYNQTQGPSLDLLQSAVQAMGEKLSDFWRYWANLDAAPDWFKQAIQRISGTIDAFAYVSDADLQSHVALYRNSISSGNRVVAVAHSQGNFYANRAYEYLYDAPDGKSLTTHSFGVVAVATPAGSVGGNGPYTTLTGDFIWLLPGARPPNLTEDCGQDAWYCHSFTKTYLNGSASRSRILNNILAVFLSLQAPHLGQWQAISSPTTIQLLGVSVISGNDVWAVGGEYGSSGVGVILHWDGNAWHRVSIPTTQVLRAIAMVSANDGWAVGGYDVGVSNILRWNGTTWTQVPSPTGYWLSGVSGLSSNEVWGVGGNGTIVQWDGTSWKVVTTFPGYNLNAIQMLSSTNGWAVGNYGLIVHWDGSSWQRVSGPPAYMFESVAMAGSNEGWIVGFEPLSGSQELAPMVLHWNGISWVKINSPTTSSLFSVTAVPPSTGWIVGCNVILSWDGSTWKNVPNPTTQCLLSVKMVSETEGWAVGAGGTILYYSVNQLP